MVLWIWCSRGLAHGQEFGCLRGRALQGLEGKERCTRSVHAGRKDRPKRQARLLLEKKLRDTAATREKCVQHRICCCNQYSKKTARETGRQCGWQQVDGSLLCNQRLQGDVGGRVSIEDLGGRESGPAVYERRQETRRLHGAQSVVKR